MRYHLWEPHYRKRAKVAMVIFLRINSPVGNLLSSSTANQFCKATSTASKFFAPVGRKRNLKCYLWMCGPMVRDLFMRTSTSD